MVATHLWYARSVCFRVRRPCSASSSPLLGGSTSSNATSSTISRKKTASFVNSSPLGGYVDAHGNPGFSGGPLVLRPLGQPLTVPVVVAGVIIDLPLDPITAEQTGLVRATSIEHVVSLIDASPLDGRP